MLLTSLNYRRGIHLFLGELKRWIICVDSECFYHRLKLFENQLIQRQHTCFNEEFGIRLTELCIKEPINVITKIQRNI